MGGGSAAPGQGLWTHSDELAPKAPPRRAGPASRVLHAAQWTLHVCGGRWGHPQAQVVPGERGAMVITEESVVKSAVKSVKMRPTPASRLPRPALCRRCLGNCKADLGEPCQHPCGAPPSWEKAHPP